MSSDPFKYVPPTPDKVPQFEAVARACADAYNVLMEFVPESAERTLAIRSLQQARMWANAAISEVQVETRGRTYG